MKYILSFFTLFFLFFNDGFCAAKWFKGGHQLWVTPEAHYVKRKREGGSKQTGAMGGIEVGYERIKKNALYWGAQGDISYGCLTGKTGDDDDIKSDLTDRTLEANLGYTFRFKKIAYLMITPIAGYGYFSQTNDFVDPSPMEMKLKNQFHFFTVGFLSSIRWSSCLNLGVRFKARWMVDGTSKIFDDPEEGTVTLSMDERWQYDVQLPMDYKRDVLGRCLTFRITPFYRYRHYGGTAGFPFDFFDTQYTLWGGMFGLVYRF